MENGKRPIRVCHVLEATEGGALEHILQLARGLDQQAFELSFVLSPRRDPDFEAHAEFLRGCGVRMQALPMHRAIRPLADLRAAWRLWRLFRRERFDIVHTHCSKAGMVGRVAAWAARRPVRIHTPHGPPFLQRVGPLKRALYKLLERAAGRITTVFIALSAFEERLLLDSGVAQPGQVRLAHNDIEFRPEPTDEDRRRGRRMLGVESDAFLVGAVGRLVEQKGHRFLVEAARRVVDARPDARFVVAGEGPLRAALEDRIGELALREHFRLLGQRDDVREWLPALDVFALPSLWEAMPYTILEAHDAGLPIVASDVCGLGEFLPCGVLVPPENPAALAEALLDLAANAEKRRALGRRGREFARERFAFPRCAEQTAAIYREAVQFRRSR